MIKEVKYKGYSAAPSDYDSPDGDFDGAMGMVPEDGGMKVVLPPTECLFKLPPELELMYVHYKPTGGVNYIFLNRADNNSLTWLDDKTIELLTDKNDGKIPTLPIGVFPLDTLGADRDIYQVLALGNTLLVPTNIGVEHYVFMESDFSYTCLGVEMPELPISFGLQAEVKRTDPFVVDVTPREGDKHISLTDFSRKGVEISESIQEKVTEYVFAEINKFVAEDVAGKDKFVFPFMIRYAYRLFDGSVTKQSSPVLMVCASDAAPLIVLTGNENLNMQYKSITMRIAAPVHTLDYQVMDAVALDKLRGWRDIIKSVDIFISKPIYTYKPDDKIKRVFSFSEDVLQGRTIKEGVPYAICKHTNLSPGSLKSKYTLRYQYDTHWLLYRDTFGKDYLGVPAESGTIPTFELPPKPLLKEEICDTNVFYRIAQINIEDLKIERSVVKIRPGDMKSLVDHEHLTDDYDSHDTLIAKSAYPYNNRVHLFNLKKKLFSGFSGMAMVPYCDGNIREGYQDPAMFDKVVSFQAYVTIVQNGIETKVHGEYGQWAKMTPFPIFFYYPNTNAKSVEILGYFTQKLTPHNFLNGSYFLNGFSDWQDETRVDYPEEKIPKKEEQTRGDIDAVISLPNKVYTSEVGNPYYFPVNGINTVGFGEVIELGVASEPLSPGQKGAFDLYAFCVDGVWAFKVTENGLYSNIVFVSPDVLIGRESIMPFRGGIMFTTDRGIMLLSGDNTICISDTINNTEPLNVIGLPKLNGLVDQSGFAQEDFNIIPFVDFARGVKMTLDYINQRIFMFNDKCTYAYVYSIESKMWGMVHNNIKYNVNMYPKSIVVTKDNSVVDLSKPSSRQGIKGILVTRPLKLDMPDTLKTVTSVIQRGYFKKGHIGVVLYGSRDLFNWHLVASSKSHILRGVIGSPYKYFRLALVCNLDANEIISGCSVEYTPKLLNKMR